MADYADVVGLSKHLLRRLDASKVVRTTDGFGLRKPIAADRKLPFLSGPSIRRRNWLNSMLAAIGVEQDQRNFLGRWRISTCADEYVRTAQHVIISLQDKLITYFSGVDEWGLRDAGLCELGDHLRTAHVPEALQKEQLQNLTLPAGWCRRVPEPSAPVPDLHRKKGRRRWMVSRHPTISQW